MPLNIDDNRIALSITPILRLAFRPLFLGGSFFSVIAIAWWTYFWINPSGWAPHGGPVWWHGHEMLFGFGAAIVVGFLLTAVQTWTGVIGIRGKPLAVLAVSWIAGRLLLAFGVSFGVSGWLIAAVDVSFLLLASIAMAYPILKIKQWHNLMFVPILFILSLLNASGHWAVINNQPHIATQSLHGTIVLFSLIITILGGRVIPAFTANTTGCTKKAPLKWLEIFSIVSIIVLVFIAFSGFDNVPPMLLLTVSVIAAIANGWRFSRWGFQHSKSEPLLWSLHLAYIFIPLGFIMLALHSIGLMGNTSAALHSITVGSIGGMILGMLSRVTLGHTGRQLNPPRMITVAYLLIFVATLVRVIVPAWLPEYTLLSIGIAGGLWVLAFSVYLYFYGFMLVTARADGRPG
ncbi:MAG: NnrS family protein [Gammaproteobacteria bacterium]|nr:NnrS family protein [Gammaproteobacteria bacterium]